MTQPDKYLIVSVDHDDYDRHIAARRLPPGQCFQALTEAEAVTFRRNNARWGIDVHVLYTDAWLSASKRKGNAA